MSRGGKREGAGRRPGARTEAQQAAIDVAKQVLDELDQVAVWKKLCQSKNEKIALGALQYLTDRAHGKARQVIAGDSEAPVTANLILVDAGAPEPKK
jgi:hypothetical protein